MGRIQIRYVESELDVPVLSDYLNVKFTYQYVKQLDDDLTVVQAKRVLFWAKKLYDDTKGINEATLKNIARGVKSLLL